MDYGIMTGDNYPYAPIKYFCRKTDAVKYCSMIRREEYYKPWQIAIIKRSGSHAGWQLDKIMKPGKTLTEADFVKPTTRPAYYDDTLPF